MTIDKEIRKNNVLEAIVKVHIETADPVSSKHIARVLNLSSATIRNVMFELEHEGYLRQPYTSAGRIPTDLGYRKYVNNMMSNRELSERGIFLGMRKYIHKKRFFEEVIESASRAISKITNYMGIALSPNNKFYFDGTYHMFEQPEFSELDMAREFLKIVEEKEDLVRLINRDLVERTTTIRIGRENVFGALRECTIVTASYKINNRVSGNVGIIGPMRMKYEKVVPAVEYLAEITTEVLEEISE